MRAQVSTLDCLESEPASSSLRRYKNHQSGDRAALRVPVKLRVAINAKHCAYLADSVDISESGVMIENYIGPALRQGSKVTVLIQGVNSDRHSNENFCRMRVSRILGSRIALSFDHRPVRSREYE